MSDQLVSLEWIGATLRQIQADQRTLRGENELTRRELGRLASSMSGLVTKDQLADVVGLIADRIANFEALVETRIDILGEQMTRVETLLRDRT